MIGGIWEVRTTSFFLKIIFCMKFKQFIAQKVSRPVPPGYLRYLGRALRQRILCLQERARKVPRAEGSAICVKIIFANLILF